MFAATLLMIAGGVTPAGADWTVYHNSRFGFEACYPRDQLKPQPVSGSGDGRKFVADDGAELRVFGEFFYDDNRSLAGRAASLDQSLKAKGANITYSVNRPTWLVRSGTSDKGIFYYKVFSAGSQLFDMEFFYPRASASRWNPIIARMSQCFPAGQRRD